MILYLNLCSTDCQANRLEKMIQKKMPGFSESLSGLRELRERIQSSVHDIDIIIIHACSDSPISELLEHRNELKDMNIVLVLNNITSDKQIEQLLKLYPRYMTFDQEYATILAVLENRIKHKQLTRKQKVFGDLMEKQAGCG